MTNDAKAIKPLIENYLRMRNAHVRQLEKLARDLCAKLKAFENAEMAQWAAIERAEAQYEWEEPPTMVLEGLEYEPLTVHEFESALPEKPGYIVQAWPLRGTVAEVLRKAEGRE